MGTKVFLGEPPANIKQWIIDHTTPSSTFTLTEGSGSSGCNLVMRVIDEDRKIEYSAYHYTEQELTHQYIGSGSKNVRYYKYEYPTGSGSLTIYAQCANNFKYSSSNGSGSASGSNSSYYSNLELSFSTLGSGCNYVNFYEK